MTVYRRNPLLMTVMGANPGGPAFIVADSITGRVMYTKRATGVGSEAINSCSAVAQRLARRNGRSYIVFLDMSRARVGGNISVSWARAMGITEEVHPDGSVTRGNPPRRRRSGENEIDSMIGAAWARFMSGVQVSVMEIPKIFRDIKLEMAAGMSLEDAVRTVGNRYRVNKNPGIGEAILGGVAGAVVSHAFRSNPHEEGEPCQMCGGPVGYLGTLGQVKHYQCRNCGAETRGADPSVHVIRRIRGIRRRPPQRPKQNPAIARSWDGLRLRPRLAILEFAGIPYEQARRLAGRPWETLPPSIREEVSKGWQENPLTKREAADALRRARSAAAYARRHRDKYYAGKAEGMVDVVYRHGPKKSKRIAGKISWRAAVAPHARPNPGPRGKRRLTMTVERFAQWVKSKRDPAMWRAFLAKFRGYEKWTHGAKARKVTVEWVDTPGVNGLWITYDGGKQPESTYIMPKGSPRKGAWKHPWDTMPDIKHDPEAKIVITKLRGSSKITDFYHK